MIGIIVGGVTGFLLGHNGYEINEPIFWAVLIPVCMVGTLIDMKLRSNVV